MLLLLSLLACDGKDSSDTDSCAGCADTAAPDTDVADTDESGDTDSADDTGPEDTDETSPPPSPPHVILFVGDGMGFPHVEGGGLYAYGAAGTLVMESLPNRGRLLSASLTGTTDSAAGATALATGVKTWNNVVGMDRDILPVASVLEDARARGMAVGVVTTDALNGATPASFFAHTDHRGNTSDIVDQLVANPPDVVLGGGYTVVNLPLAGIDAQLVRTRSELLAAVPDGRPFFGLFADSTLPYVGDGYVEQPTLAEMTAFAIDVLEEDPDGFFLMVEGARIDHASHSNDGDQVHLETASLDEAVAVAATWAETLDETPTIVVTADHECGGLAVSGGGPAGTVPESDWRWGSHTNADIPVFGLGDLTGVFDGQRLDNTWVHAVLASAIAGDRTVTAPAESLLVDGRTEDLGPPVATQAWETSFGLGFNQLDALRITADTDGLWIGVDGVFERGENSTLLLLDVDYGAGTGWGADATTLEDVDGTIDTLLTSMPYTSGIDGMGFDLVVCAIGAEELALGDLSEVSGLRGLHGAWGSAADFWWLLAQTSFDDGNVAERGAARDASSTGTTSGGWEVHVPWWSIYPSGIPASGMDVAVVAVLLNADGTLASNQALPSLPTGASPGGDAVLLESAVRLQLDATGTPLGPAVVVP